MAGDGKLFDDGRGDAGREHAFEELMGLDSAILHDAIAEAVRTGWMVSLSASRDGYAIRVAVLDDGERSQIWCEDTASLERALMGLTRSAQARRAGDAEIGPGKAGRPV